MTVTVQPQPDSRLEQLAAEYDKAKSAADEAKARLDQIAAGIKAELYALAPNETAVDLISAHLAKPLQLRYVEAWRFDSKRFKQDDPLTYVKYAKQGGSWRLARGSE